MKKIAYITIVATLLAITVKAQQLPLSSLYNVNKFQINSAYAGFNECAEGYLSHRPQWVGIDGSPTTNFLSFHSGVAKNMGLGVNFVMDKTDIISKFRGSLSFAYRVKLGAEQNIRFGLSAGIYQLKIDPTSAIVDDVNDEIFQSGNQSSIVFNNGFGIFYNYKKLQIGISIPQLMESNSNFELINSEEGFWSKRDILSYAEYDIRMSENISFQPSILYKTILGKQGQLDINGQINYKQLFFVGAGYRTNGGLLARLGIVIKDQFTVAYAYEFAGNSVSSSSGASYEIMVGIKFCKKKSDKTNKEIAPEPVVVVSKLAVEPEPKPIPAPTPEPIIVEEPKQDIVKVTEANTEYNKPENIIRYQHNASDNSISENERRLVNETVDFLKNNPQINVIVEGHTCDQGAEEFNQLLSEKRAQRIAGLITAGGIDKSRVSAIGKGEDAPIKPNTSEENRRENRRVQLIFTE